MLSLSEIDVLSLIESLSKVDKLSDRLNDVLVLFDSERLMLSDV